MTCFWDGVLRALKEDDYRFISEKRCNRVEFIKMLKRRNIPMTDVVWNGKKLRNQEINEHQQAIKEYNISGINNGHLTSTCDSFLLLICQLFKVGIRHRYLNTVISYNNEKESRKVLNFSSNSGHFK